MIKLYKGLDKKLDGQINFDKKNSYIYEVDDKIIGYFNLTPILECISIDAEILEEFRNKGLGNLFLKNISNFAASKYNEYEKLLLLINYLNTKAINTAIKNGYTEDYFLFDNQENELPNTKVYTKKIKK